MCLCVCEGQNSTGFDARGALCEIMLSPRSQGNSFRGRRMRAANHSNDTTSDTLIETGPDHGVWGEQ